MIRFICVAFALIFGVTSVEARMCPSAREAQNWVDVIPDHLRSGPLVYPLLGVKPVPFREYVRICGAPGYFAKSDPEFVSFKWGCIQWANPANPLEGAYIVHDQDIDYCPADRKANLIKHEKAHLRDLLAWHHSHSGTPQSIERCRNYPLSCGK